MTGNLNSSQIMSVWDLLQRDLQIPNYQRPYKWSVKSVADLLGDMENAIIESKKYGADYKYRIGTVILHNEGGKYNIVDGQQRCITLALLLHNFGKDIPFLKQEISCLGYQNIWQNHHYIRQWLNLKSEEQKKEIKNSLQKIFEFVILTVKQTNEAFQLFDSQNARGRELYPHDLLKAYHLREMQNDDFRMRYAVTRWEAIKPEKIRTLFSRYLFPILKWSNNEKHLPFTADKIDVYKGVSEKSLYTYAKRVKKAMPVFQIPETFVAGYDFFEMVEHYSHLTEFIRQWTDDYYKRLLKKTNDDVSGKKLMQIKYNQTKTKGFEYALELFECAVFCYYDKFQNLDELVINQFFVWAMMLRVDMQTLSPASVNRYAIGGDDNKSYTNNIPVFSLIRQARLHIQLRDLSLRMQLVRKDTSWRILYKFLKEVNGDDTKQSKSG